MEKKFQANNIIKKKQSKKANVKKINLNKYYSIGKIEIIISKLLNS